MKLKMYNSGIVIAGLIVFVGLMAYPIWSSLGNPAPKPEVELTDKAKAAKECIEAKSFMTESHMQLLDDWRNEVVRSAQRIYTNSAGKEFSMSLSNTCMDCHSNKANFCDRCHNYASVRPYCWDCHLAPEGKQNEQ